jgi:flagellar biosynthesis component FlhA
MFWEILNRYISIGIKKGKLEYIFSRKNKPDVVLFSENGIALALRYDQSSMDAPIIILKEKCPYIQELLTASNIKNIPIIKDNELTNNIYNDCRNRQVIPYKYYEAVAELYAHIHALSKNEEKKQHFDHFEEILHSQRKNIYEILYIVPYEKIILELGNNLISIINDLDFKITILGIQIVKIKITGNNMLDNDEFCIKLNGTAIKRGKIQYLGMSPVSLLHSYLSETLTCHADELIGRDDLASMINNIENKHPIVIKEIMEYYSIGEIRKVIRNLLHENVPIRNIITIFETMADFGDDTHDIELITENVRQSIGRDICSQYLNNNILKAFSFKYESEELIVENYIKGIKNLNFYESFLKTLHDIVGVFEKQNLTPILISSSKNRRMLKNITEKTIPQLVVLSSVEINKEIIVKNIREIEI